ncbi:MAG: glycosyltransferase family 2 protein, partial [Culicoidibacterales bacterium]
MYQLAIIIPVYNSEKALPKLLLSLLPQITPEVQCVFIDDGSNDKSYEFLCQQTKDYPTITVVKQVNRGVAATRNRGMELTTSRLLWFVDGDDWLEQDAVRTILAASHDREQAMYHFNFEDHFLNGNTQLNPYFLKQAMEYKGEAFYYQSLRNFGYETKNMVWSFIFDREFLQRHQLQFDETLPIFEDVLFLAQCYQTNEMILILDYSLYHYQQHPTSLTHTPEHFQEMKYRRLIEKLQAIVFTDAQLQKQLQRYQLLLASKGLPLGESELISELLTQNHHSFLARNQSLYRYYWQIKLF